MGHAVYASAFPPFPFCATLAISSQRFTAQNSGAPRGPVVEKHRYTLHTTLVPEVKRFVVHVV